MAVRIASWKFERDGSDLCNSAPQAMFVRWQLCIAYHFNQDCRCKESCHASLRFAWKQWNTNLQLPNTNVFTTDEHLPAAPCQPCGCCCPSWRFPPMASLLQAKLNCVRLLLPGKPTRRGSHEICRIIWLFVLHVFCRHVLYVTFKWCLFWHMLSNTLGVNLMIQIFCSSSWDPGIVIS